MKNLTDIERFEIDDDTFEMPVRKSRKKVKKPWILEVKTSFNFLKLFPDWYRIGKYETEEQLQQAYNDILKKGIYKDSEIRIIKK